MDLPRRLNAIMFADIAGYTSTMQTNESLARQQIQKFSNLLESLIPQYDGRIINFMGDGCLCIFESSVNAIECAVKLQEKFMEGQKIPVRIGIHSGDVYFENNSVFGDSVNIASRIESIGIPGSILFSERVFNDINNHPSFKAKPLGDVNFKNISRPIKVYGLDAEWLTLPNPDQLEGKLAPNKRKKKRWVQYLVPLVFAIAAIYLYQTQWNKDGFNSSVEQDVLTVAILDIENKTGEDQFNMLSEICSDRFINAIRQIDVANVISSSTVEEYQNILVASALPLNKLALLHEKFGVNRIVEGQIYRLGDDLLLECTITDPETREIISATPTVKFNEEDPMIGIEEMRKHILSALAIDQDRSQNLLLETNPPNYEAYKMLLAAKQVESEEEIIALLEQAIELDSNYFEPHVLRISGYYNLGEFEVADSITKVLERKFIDADPRQKNLLNFYKALMSGENNLVYYHSNEELEKAPFEMMTNNTVMVLATEFINDVQKAFDIYNVIDESILDFGNCDRCRTRIYIKIYMDLEKGDPENALRLIKILSDNGDKTRIERLRIRALVRSDKWDELSQYINDEQITNGTDIGSLSLYAAKECALAGDQSKFEFYKKQAYDNLSKMATTYRKGEIALINDDYTSAIKYFQETVDDDKSDVQNLCMLAAATILDGSEAHGNKLLESADQMRKPYQYGKVDYYLSEAYSIIGDNINSLNSLQSAISQGRRVDYFEFHNSYWLIPISKEPKFKEILDYWKS